MSRHANAARRTRRDAGRLAVLLMLFGLTWSGIGIRFESALHAATTRIRFPASPRPKGDPNTPDESRTGGVARG